MEVAIRIQDPSGTVTRDVVVRAQDGNTVHELIQVLVDVMEWPRQTLGGEPIVYRLRRPDDAEPLDEEMTVVSLEIVQGDALVLGPQ